MKTGTKWRILQLSIVGVLVQVFVVYVLFGQTWFSSDSCCFNESSGFEHDRPFQLRIGLFPTENKRMCKVTYTNKTDILKMKTPYYLKWYKNPCWVSQGGRFLCIPYFYLAGFAKCGTTDLFRKISLHPEFSGPSIKEPNWLSNGRFKNGNSSSLQHYASSYFYRASREIRKSGQDGRNSTLITGEASINTIDGSLFWQIMPENSGQPEPIVNNPEFLYHINPNVRILINVRNPVDRLWSEYLAFTSDKLPSAQKFHNIVLRILKIYHGCLEHRSLRSCMYSKRLAEYSTMNDRERLEHPDGCGIIPKDIVYLRRGIYHIFIRDYLKVFPRGHILIQRLEDISVNQKRAVLEVYQFLGMKPIGNKLKSTIATSSIRNTRKPAHRRTGDMLKDTRDILNEFYKPHNEELARLLNDTKYRYED